MKSTSLISIVLRVLALCLVADVEAWAADQTASSRHGFDAASLPTAVRKALLHESPCHGSGEIAQVNLGRRDGSRDYVVACDAGTALSNVLAGNVRFEVALYFETINSELKDCAGQGPDDCPLEATAIPTQDQSDLSMMVRSRYGCGIFAWYALAARWHSEPHDCKEETRAYVMRWAQCTGEGGTWYPQGMLGFTRCVHPSRDGGNACTDDSQCEYGCLADPRNLTSHGAAPLVGRCKPDDNPFGCSSNLRNGAVVVGICAD